MLIIKILLRSSQSDNCINKPLTHFPEIDSINREYHPVRFDGSFDFSSPYKGPPSPEVNAAWENITELIGISIPEPQFVSLNASIHSIKVPPKFGGGYLALPEFVHQIHCVHMLWQATYPAYYNTQFALSKSNPSLYHAHMDHCADLLRQKLMCDVDMGLLTFNWVRGHSIPGPNFNVQHQCRNFDAAMEWAWKRRIDVEGMKGEWWKRPESGEGEGWVEFEEPPRNPEDGGLRGG